MRSLFIQAENMVILRTENSFYNEMMRVISFLYNCDMEYVDIKTKKTIKTNPISKDKFADLLLATGIGSLDELTKDAADKLIKSIIAEYKMGSVSLDELSSAFGIVYEKTIYNSDFGEINEILEIGSDLSYGERMSTSQQSGKDLVGYLEAVLNYGK